MEKKPVKSIALIALQMLGYVFVDNGVYPRHQYITDINQ